MRYDVSDRYAANAVLASDIAKGEFDFDLLSEKIETRFGGPLGYEEREEIVKSVNRLVIEAQPKTFYDDTTNCEEFPQQAERHCCASGVVRSRARIRLSNPPHVMDSRPGVCNGGSVRFHPKYDGSLVFLTSTLTLNEGETELVEIAFDYGLKRTGEDFLAKLYAAYQKVSGLTNATFVTAWELRSVFCFDNKCQPSVFDKLFGDSASGSVEISCSLNFQRQKPQHENTLRANNRNIGSVRVVRR